jgi:hypothetical protein
MTLVPPSHRFPPMKITVTLAATFVFLGHLVTAGAQVSPVTVRVEQVAKSESEKFSRTQKRSLKIAVTNASPEDKSLKVKFYFFGKDSGENDLLLLEKGERAATVPARQTVTIETPTVSRRAVEEHYAGKSGGQGGARRGKKVEASGQRIVGHGVQVFEAGKLVAEYFTQPEFKAKVAPKQ